MWDPYADFQSVTLPNGLMVYAAHWPGRPWEAMGFLIHSGAEHEPVGKEGLAHFVEHLVSANAPVSKEEMRAFFEDCGGVSFGRTGYASTSFSFFVPAEKTVLTKAFSMFGYMLLLAKLEKFIARERQVVIREFYQHYPVKFKLDLVMREHKMLYTGSFLERRVRPIGTPESIFSITPSELQSYYDAHYTPANISIVGVGGLQLPELIELLSKSPFFTVKKEGRRTPLPTPLTEVTPPLETRYIFEMSKHLNDPFEIGGYRSVGKIPGNISEGVIYMTTLMLNEVLEEEVRERRAWSYDINASYYNLRHFYEFALNCGGLSFEALDNIEEVIEVCIASMSERQQLFQRIKRRALTTNFLVDPTGVGLRDDALDDLATHQRIITLKEVGEDLERVTMNDIEGVLRWLHPSRRWTLIIR